MATKPTNPKEYRPSWEAQELDKIRDSSAVRAWAAMLLTGNRNSAATGLARITQSPGVDIFAAAAASQPVGANPLNNFLGADMKPLFTFFPKAVGVYIGGMGDTAVEDFAQIVAETCMLEVKPAGGANIVKQPVITIPAGLGMEKWDSSGLGPASRLGGLTPDKLFQLPPDIVMSKDQSYSAMLSTTAGGVVAFAAAAGAFPNQGAIIAVCLYGIGEFKVSPTRG